jgi:hypothetical protein
MWVILTLDRWPIPAPIYRKQGRRPGCICGARPAVSVLGGIL